ncbi:Uncharacterised protein [Mycobacteroides abscessus subsp. abscessus]|nr:Uncharacterised protein [Mycobacteroides abscessus subsp. abscessus]SKU45503.1 Uncharacterised protein [Mycobacteroides abscessus subsp. abscessus]
MAAQVDIAVLHQDLSALIDRRPEDLLGFVKSTAHPDVLRPASRQQQNQRYRSVTSAGRLRRSRQQRHRLLRRPTHHRTPIGQFSAAPLQSVGNICWIDFTIATDIIGQLLGLLVQR